VSVYIVRVYDINGRAATVEDDEDSCKEWLWRTLKRQTNDGKPVPYQFRSGVELVKLEDDA
jgi:hypothetical protein